MISNTPNQTLADLQEYRQQQAMQAMARVAMPSHPIDTKSMLLALDDCIDDAFEGGKLKAQKSSPYRDDNEKLMDAFAYIFEPKGYRTNICFHKYNKARAFQKRDSTVQMLRIAVAPRKTAHHRTPRPVRAAKKSSSSTSSSSDSDGPAHPQYVHFSIPSSALEQATSRPEVRQ